MIPIRRPAVLLAVALALISAKSFPQNASAPGPGKSAVIEPDARDYRPGANTMILAELENDLDAKKAKPGDTVHALVLQDLVYKGKIVVPRNSKVVGHIISVKLPRDNDPRSELGLVFEEIALPNKKHMPFQNPAIIEAVAPPIRKVATPSTRMSDMPVQMEKGQSSGGAALDRLVNNANLAGANLPSIEGVISTASRGVIDLPGLTLDNSNARFSVLRSQKGDLKLGFESQVVLRVTEDSK